MTTRVVLATRNDHKVAELRRILAEAGLDVEIVGTDVSAQDKAMVTVSIIFLPPRSVFAAIRNCE